MVVAGEGTGTAAPSPEGAHEKAISGELTPKRRQILEFIAAQQRARGYPPSVREIGDAVGLASPSTVHAHLATLQRQGFLRRDPSKPRAIEVHFDFDQPATEAPTAAVAKVPLLGDVAAGTDVLAQQDVEEILPLPRDVTGSGELFALRVRGESMIEAGILPGDIVVVRRQPSAQKGEIVVAGIPGDEATVKTYSTQGRKVVLTPANSQMEPLVHDPSDVTIYGRVVSVVRRV